MPLILLLNELKQTVYLCINTEKGRQNFAPKKTDWLRRAFGGSQESPGYATLIACLTQELFLHAARSFRNLANLRSNSTVERY